MLKMVFWFAKAGPTKHTVIFRPKSTTTILSWMLNFCRKQTETAVYFSAQHLRVQVAPPNHDTGGIYESYGRGWLVQIPDEKEDILKMGEWNKMKIRVVGGHVTTWLNGQQMVDITDDKIAEGKGAIALQIHDGGGIKVKWRNLMVKEL